MKLGKKNLGSLLQKLWRPKTSTFGANFGKLHNLIANISGTKQDVVERKTALQTPSLAQCATARVHNLLNFGPQTAKNKTGDCARIVWVTFRVLPRVCIVDKVRGVKFNSIDLSHCSWASTYITQYNCCCEATVSTLRR